MIAGAQAKQRSFQPLPQPRSLASALLEMQLTLLGSLLAVVSQANQLQVIGPLATINRADTQIVAKLEPTNIPATQHAKYVLLQVAGVV